jgi:adenylate cyclase
VNLASRLESLNKEHHTKLLMSEATERHLGPELEVKHLGAIPVRGKTAPINLYTVAALLVPAAAETSAVTAPPVEA